MAECSHTRHRPEVNELDLLFGDNNVVGFEIVVDNSARMEIIQRQQYFQDVADCGIDFEDTIRLVAT